MAGDLSREKRAEIAILVGRIRERFPRVIWPAAYGANYAEANRIWLAVRRENTARVRAARAAGPCALDALALELRREGRTLREVGQEMSICRERARQRVERAAWRETNEAGEAEREAMYLETVKAALYVGPRGHMAELADGWRPDCEAPCA